MSLRLPWEEHYDKMQEIKKTILSFDKKHLASDDFRQYNRLYLDLLLERLMSRWQAYQRAFTAFESVFNERASDDENDEEDQLSYISNIVGDCEKVIRSRIKQLSAKEEQPAPKPSDIHLTKYDGDYADWSSWSTQVQSAVLETDIPIHSKIDLILNALEGNISSSIGRAEGRDQHELDRIWGKLQKLCNNNYDRARTHIGQILDLPDLTRPTDKEFRKMIDTVDFQLRALKRMDYKVEAWDPIIVEVLLRKLDKCTIRSWEKDRTHQDLPELQELVAFFERQIQALRNIRRSIPETNGRDQQQAEYSIHKRAASSFPRNREQPSKRHQHSSQSFSTDNRKMSAHPHYQGDKKTSESGPQPTRPSKCRMDCHDNRPHFLWNCKSFRNLTLEERAERIRVWNVCKRCLVARHDAKSCTALRCDQCQEVHNPILCPKSRVFAAVNSVQLRKRTTTRFPKA